MSSFSWTCRRLLMITVAACSSSLYTDSVNTASQFKSLCQELPRLVSRSRSWRQLSRHSVIVQQWELPSNVHVRYQEYIITRVSNFQYPRRNTVYKVTWLPVYCTWASVPDCRGSTRLAVSNLGYFSFISGTACPLFSKNGFLIHFSGVAVADDVCAWPCPF